MKKFHLINNLEKGQIIPLVVVMFFVLIAMVALIIDGGALMSNRQTAQAAADAGALAGAQRACLGENDAASVAVNYATLNGASSASPTVVGKQVTVNVTVEHPSYFAGIFGDPTLEANAEAIAGCYGVKAKANTVFPMAFPCIPNNGGPYDPAFGCKIQTLNWNDIGPLVDPNWDPPSERVTDVDISDYDGNPDTYHMSGTSIVNNTGVPPEQIYIIFDNDKICDNPSCGYNGGGLEWSGGHRGWLDLDPIDYYINDLIDGKPGVAKGHLDETWMGHVYMLPIYDVFSGGKYHAVSFAPFYVSCVDKKGKNCPGSKHEAINLNDAVVEGYFLSNYDVSADFTDDCSINLGNCTVSLSK